MRKSFRPPGAYTDLVPQLVERLFGERVCRLAQAPCELFHDAQSDLEIGFNRRFEVPEWHHQGLRTGFRPDHRSGPRLLIDQSHLTKKLASTQLRDLLLSITDLNSPAHNEIVHYCEPTLLLDISDGL